MKNKRMTHTCTQITSRGNPMKSMVLAT